MKLLHFSDTHVGNRQYRLQERKRDFLDAFNEVVDRALDERPDVVIHTGDLFNSPRPDNQSSVAVAGRFRELTDAGVRVVLIPGNHDIRQVRYETSLLEIFTFQGVDVLGVQLEDPACRKDRVEIDGVTFFGLQGFSRGRQERLREEVGRLAEEAAGLPLSVLLLHQFPDLVKYRVAVDEERLGLGLLGGAFRYAAFGHPHSRAWATVDGVTVGAPGSTERASRQEKGPRGFYLFDLEEPPVKEPFIELKSPRPFVFAEVSGSEGAENEAHLITGELRRFVEKEKRARAESGTRFKEPVVCLAGTVPTDYDIAQLRRQLTKAGVKSRSDVALTIVDETRREERPDRGQGLMAAPGKGGPTIEDVLHELLEGFPDALKVAQALSYDIRTLSEEERSEEKALAALRAVMEGKG